MRLAVAACSLVIFVVPACQDDARTRLAGTVVVNGDAISASLTGSSGNAEAGRAEFVSRDGGHCVLCHAIDGLDAEFQGNVGPELTGLGARLSPGQIRYRIVDAQQIWPDTVMPSYYRVGGLSQVDRKFEGEPVLSAQQIEDLVAFLSSQGT